MARIKYAPGEEPIRNEHSGYTFQRNNYGYSMFPGQKNDRFRNARQDNRQQCNQKAVKGWRELSVTDQSAWDTFALAAMIPTREDPAVFLTGYQLFVKRQTYCFLNHGIYSDFMAPPVYVALPEDPITIVIQSSDTQIDCTELYTRNFGLLPQVGDTMLFRAFIYDEYSSNFFTTMQGQVKVTAVYMDGLFADVQIPITFQHCVVSLYLSKPVKAGQAYVGTKVRYMGCFTPKTFVELQDVPAVSPADIGKAWGVAPDQSWQLIDVSGGGGGNAFNPINVSGMPSVTADQAAEPLEFVAGTGITIVTSNSPKRITFSSSPGFIGNQIAGIHDTRTSVTFLNVYTNGNYKIFGLVNGYVYEASTGFVPFLSYVCWYSASVYSLEPVLAITDPNFYLSMSYVAPFVQVTLHNPNALGMRYFLNTQFWQLT